MGKQTLTQDQLQLPETISLANICMVMQSNCLITPELTTSTLLRPLLKCLFNSDRLSRKPMHSLGEEVLPDEPVAKSKMLFLHCEIDVPKMSL